MVEAYLERVRFRLARRWPRQDTEDQISELRQHLAESIEDRVARGIDRSLAIRESLKLLGSDRLLAENLIRAQSGADRRSVWRIGWLPALLAAVLLSAPELLPAIDWPYNELAESMLTTIAWAFLATLIVVAWRSRRLLVAPMATAFGAAAALSIVWNYTYGPFGFSDYSRRTRVAEVTRFDRYIEGLEKAASKARETLASGEPPLAPNEVSYEAPVRERIATSFGLAYVPVSWSTGSQWKVFLNSTPSRAEALRLWEQNGSAYVAQLVADIDDQRRLQEVWSKGRAPGIKAALFTILCTGGALALVLMINAAVLGLVWTRKRLLQAAWRPG